MPTTSPANSIQRREFENLPATLDGEHSALQGLVSRRLRQTLKSRRAAKAAVNEAAATKSAHAPAEIDPLELLELLGQLNKPQGRRQTVGC